MAKAKKAKGKKGRDSANKDGDCEANENSRAYFTHLINDTEDSLRRSKEECKILETENREHKLEHQRHEQDKSDMSSYYMLMGLNSQQTLRDLIAEKRNLEETFDAINRQTEVEFQALGDKMEYEINTLISENAMLSSQVQSMSDYSNKRDDLENKYKDLEAQLVECNCDHSAELYILEKDQVQEKGRLKLEMQSRVNNVASEFRRVSNQQMAETTKRTISVNLVVNARLVKLTEKVKIIMNENEFLRKKLSERTRKLEILEKNERSLIGKNKCSSRLISLLVDKSHEIETDLCVTEEVLDETLERLRGHEEEKEERDCKRSKFNDLKSMNSSLNKRKTELTAAVEKISESNKNLRRLVDRCTLDFGHHNYGLSDNILPGLLTVLTSLSSPNVKKTVEKDLIKSAGSLSICTYTNGNVGLVPKD